MQPNQPSNLGDHKLPRYTRLRQIFMGLTIVFKPIHQRGAKEVMPSIIKTQIPPNFISHTAIMQYVAFVPKVPPSSKQFSNKA